MGLVLSKTDHKETQSLRSWCKVIWDLGNKNDYRNGHEGKCDLVVIEGASGGFYYPEHLAPLGCPASLPPKGKTCGWYSLFHLWISAWVEVKDKGR